MTKKFTEEEYQKITDCFDKLEEIYNMGVMNPNLLIQIQDELFGEFDFINDLVEIFAIANPATRDGAHEKFVDKENNYYWKYKFLDEEGDTWYLVEAAGLIILRTNRISSDSFTEKEIIESGYNPDMYEKEEVE